MDLDHLDLSRIQFATTSIYHFIFVPLTIGLAFLVALLHTRWYRTRDPEMRRLTKFFGTLLLINVAIGVVTGLVQEFQFGMNWSAYSRFVGDVFGAPLAMEGLAAFFLESTFLGLWLFGWNVLPRGIHLATIWAAFIGTVLSAAFIMAANSWMQHPVGYEIDESTGRAQLTDIGALFTNPVFVWGYIHVLLASLVSGAIVMLAVSVWQIRKRGAQPFVRTAKLAIGVLVPTSVLILLVGSQLGVIEAEYQPMKVAAMEAQWDDCGPCSFSVFQIRGGPDEPDPSVLIAIPHLLSILATGTWDGEVTGLTNLQAQYEQEYGPGDYIPNVFIQYWAMRVMAYIGSLLPLLALWGVWVWWRRRWPRARVFMFVATWAALTPFLMNTAGWLLTENGRQPWIVQGLQLTSDGVTPSISTTEVAVSLGAFVALYLALGIVWLFLMLRFARRALPEDEAQPHEPEHTDVDPRAPRAPVLTY